MRQIFFLDIDDCLIHTSRLEKEEITAVEQTLKSFGVAKSKEITREFVSSFHRLYAKHQNKPLSPTEQKLLNDFLQRMEEIEKPIIKKWGHIKKWSREVFLYIACEKYGVKLSALQLHTLTQNLWNEIAAQTPFYPDAKAFLDYLFKNKVPFYLISSSDCRLQYDAVNDTFLYDPLYSKNLKMKRLQKCIDLGIDAENIFIAEPYDKPDPRVFVEALKKARVDAAKKGYEIDKTVMVGDSISNDLIPAKKAGIQLLVFLNKDAQKESEKRADGIIVIRSLTSLIPLIQNQ